MNEHYFLGSSSPCGFVTPIKELLGDTDNTVYLLKGTAGCGKSTLMKKISAAFSDEPQEIYHCSSDPDSLDAVYLKNRKAIIMDGTAPHCFDPVYPKAVESIIDLGAYLDTAKLRQNKKDIITVTDECAGFHKRCRLCLAAISSVISDMLSAAAESLDIEKLNAFTSRTSKRLIPRKAEKTACGKVTAKQLSAMTMNGYKTYLPEYEKIYLLSDSFMAGSDIFLRDICDSAVRKGYDVIVSRCPLCTEMYYEHVLIPELGIAFISSGCINSITVEGSKKVINFRRFYSPTPIIKQRLKFGKKAASEIIREAASAMQSAKDIHDTLEKYYVSAADFDSLNRLSYKLISEIKSL
jgi:energy-coupling factor transporter ATP-binding protein EcfA2